MFEAELILLKEALEKALNRPFDAKSAIQAYQKQLSEAPIRPDRSYVRLSGAHGGKFLLQELTKAMGDLQVANDTCTGVRYLDYPIEKEEDFFSWYAQALYNQEMPCMRMEHNGLRFPSEPGSILGTVINTVKFCDYYGFEYMHHKNSFDNPLLKVETDMTPVTGQLTTRLEAFREELIMEHAKNHQIRFDVYTAGIDSGSASTDAVIMNGSHEIVGSAIVSTGSGALNSAEKALAIALRDAGLSKDQLSYIVTTGYGRGNLGVGQETVTEITCHARGANYLNPDARTVIDIGGQDSKVIRIDENGKVLNFVMNDKCAAGTGRFLEMQARAMGMTVQEMSMVGLTWQKDLTISSMCTVFAESEVVGLVAQNTPTQDIVHALNKAVASKTVSLVNRIGAQPGYIMTGGVAANAGVVQCLEERLDEKLYISDQAQLCGAIGASLIALDRISV